MPEFAENRQFTCRLPRCFVKDEPAALAGEPGSTFGKEGGLRHSSGGHDIELVAERGLTVEFLDPAVNGFQIGKPQSPGCVFNESELLLRAVDGGDLKLRIRQCQDQRGESCAAPQIGDPVRLRGDLRKELDDHERVGGMFEVELLFTCDTGQIDIFIGFFKELPQLLAFTGESGRGGNMTLS